MKTLLTILSSVPPDTLIGQVISQALKSENDTQVLIRELKDQAVQAPEGLINIIGPKGMRALKRA